MKMPNKLFLIFFNARYRGVQFHEDGFDGRIIEEFISSFAGGAGIFLNRDGCIRRGGVEDKGNLKIEVETVFEYLGDLFGAAVVFTHVFLDLSAGSKRYRQDTVVELNGSGLL